MGSYLSRQASFRVTSDRRTGLDHQSPTPLRNSRKLWCRDPTGQICTVTPAKVSALQRRRSRKHSRPWVQPARNRSAARHTTGSTTASCLDRRGAGNQRTQHHRPGAGFRLTAGLLTTFIVAPPHRRSKLPQKCCSDPVQAPCPLRGSAQGIKNLRDWAGA